MSFVAGSINYAESYQRALAQAYPNVLHFAELRSTENDSRYKWVDSKTIKIPSIRTSGRVDANRDSITLAQRNYDNAWETKTLDHERKWSTLVHPMDIDETNQVASIQNITKTFNEEQKFPEMDAYLVSKIYADWTTTVSAEGYTGHVADETELTVDTVLTVFDSFMVAMDEKNVPATGRILYVTPVVKKMIENADQITRMMSVQEAKAAINRAVNRLDEVVIKAVPSILMKTLYDFTEGYAPSASAAQINMLLIHPSAVITPEKYETVKLDAPSAVTEGKYDYYEESHDGVFILNKRADAIQFNITPASSSL